MTSYPSEGCPPLVSAGNMSALPRHLHPPRSHLQRLSLRSVQEPKGPRGPPSAPGPPAAGLRPPRRTPLQAQQVRRAHLQTQQTNKNRSPDLIAAAVRPHRPELPESTALARSKQSGSMKHLVLAHLRRMLTPSPAQQQRGLRLPG